MKYKVIAAHTLIALLVLPQIVAAGDKQYGTEKMNTPAVFTVTDDVKLKDPGPWSACITHDKAYNTRGAFSYEPISFNNLLRPTVDHADRIYVNGGKWMNSMQSGVYDGAEAHVCRIINGKWTVVRKGKIKEHISEDWYQYQSNLKGLMWGKADLIPAGGSFKIAAQPGWQRDQPIYIGLASFNRDCHPSEIIGTSIQLEEVPLDAKGNPRKAGKADRAATGRKIKFKEDGRPSAPPSGLKAEYDAESQLITVTWADSPDQDVVGYTLQISHLSPEKHRGHYMEFADKAANEEEKIKAKDVVFIRKCFYTSEPEKNLHGIHKSTWGFTKQTPGTPFANGKDALGTWSFVEHPEPLPKSFKEPGKTCMKVELTESGEQSVSIAKYQAPRNWYAPLEAGETYRIEGWFRQEELENSKVRVDIQGSFDGKSISPVEWDIGKNWEHFSYDFTVPGEMKAGAGGIRIIFSGPGTIWMDNLRVYKANQPFMEMLPWNEKHLTDAKAYWWRDHSYIKSSGGYTMEDILNPPGVSSYKGFEKQNHASTLPAWLAPAEKLGMQPWFQVEMFMDDADWLAMIEYIAAPYDPAKDTPQSKPWAYRRYLQGHPEPWADSFDKMAFEVSNETWNGPFAPWVFMGATMVDATTGEEYSNGQLLGFYQEWMIDVYESSPYWDRIKGKAEFVIGGWIGPVKRADVNGFGPDAVQLSPRSDWLTVAVYNGGWDTGEGAVAPNDPSYFNTMMNVPWSTIPSARGMAKLQQELKKMGREIKMGTYEAGPGYQIKGLSQAKKKDQAYVMTSQCSGVANLDTFLSLAYYGNLEMQVYFAYSAGSDMSIFQSHAREDFGGNAYPQWKLVELYNRQAQGDYLAINTESVPGIDLPKYKRRSEMKDTPMAAAYATRKGDRVSLFLISRKIDGYPVEGDDGYTPTTVNLPFKTAGKVTLHKMAGPLREHNAYEDNVIIEQLDLNAEILKDGELIVNAASGMDDRGLPPGSMLLYIFEEVR